MRLLPTVLLAVAAMGCAEQPRPAAEPRTSSAAVQVEHFTVRTDDGGRGLDRSSPARVEFTLRYRGGGQPAVALRRGERVIERQPVDEMHHGFDLKEPGDYTVEVEAGGQRLASRRVTARGIACAGGRRRLMARPIRSPRIAQDLNAFVVEVPRWSPNDADPAYVVEWLYEGKLLYEGQGRLPLLETIAESVERSFAIEHLDSVCAFTYGERYPGPALDQRFRDLPGAWEVRIHREGEPSRAARFTMLRTDGRDEEIEEGGHDGWSDRTIGRIEGGGALELRRIDTPKEIAARLTAIPPA